VAQLLALVKGALLLQPQLRCLCYAGRGRQLGWAHRSRGASQHRQLSKGLLLQATLALLPLLPLLCCCRIAAASWRRI